MRQPTMCRCPKRSSFHRRVRHSGWPMATTLRSAKRRLSCFIPMSASPTVRWRRSMRRRTESYKILMSGRTPVTERGRFGGRSVPAGWGQEMRDQAALVREACEWDYELRFPEQIDEILIRAHAIANSTPKGPVYLSLPSRGALRDAAQKPGLDAVIDGRGQIRSQRRGDRDRRALDERRRQAALGHRAARGGNEGRLCEFCPAVVGAFDPDLSVVGGLGGGSNSTIRVISAPIPSHGSPKPMSFSFSTASRHGLPRSTCPGRMPGSSRSGRTRCLRASRSVISAPTSRSLAKSKTALRPL